MTDAIMLPPVAEVVPDSQNPALVYLAGLASTKSRSTMVCALRSVARILGAPPGPGVTPLRAIPWHLLRYQHAAAVQAKLVEPGADGKPASPTTARHRMAALRGTLKAAWLLGLMSGDDYERTKHLSPVAGERLLAGRMLSIDEIGALFAQCEAPGIRNARDGAILALLCAGLRRFEVVGLDLSSFVDSTGSVRFVGKRNKERIVRLPPGSLRMVKRWLEYRGAEPGPLVLPIDVRGTAHMRRCGDTVIPDMLAALGKAAGLAHFTAHDFRRTLISQLLHMGVDVSTIARNVGHQSVDTTARYDRRPEETAAAAMDRVYVPGKAWKEGERQ